MKKTFAINDLDCAVCAGKIENALRKLSGVKEVSVNFIAGKLTLEADEAGYDELMKDVKKTVKRIEPDCTLVM